MLTLPSSFKPGAVTYTVFILAYALYRWQNRRRSRLSLPPGPKKLPLVGNLFDIPTEFEWETYAHWSEVYNSDILHLDAAGKSIIIVNSHQVAYDLFEKRSSIYSSRPETTMVKDLIKFDWLFGFMAYGEPWKERRKLFQKHFHPLDTESHQPKEQEYIHRLLKELHKTPEKFLEHIRDAIGAITITIAYGLDIKPPNDPYIEIAEEALIALAAGAAPGAFLVDSIPILKYVPSWFPGAGFKRKAEVWKTWATKLVNVPFDDAQKEIAAGTAPPSFVSTCLNNLDESKDIAAQKLVIRDTAGNFFVGGADTSVSSINTFMLQMTCNPKILAKAQAELDRVVGKNTLPTFADEPSLVYIGAIVKEVLRWHAVTPLAIPHFSTEDDEYNGYFIPKGSIVVGNAWAILHDKRDYSDPLEFRPERWLTPDEKAFNHSMREPLAAFGFGRRICPGKHMANSMLFIAISSIVAAFDIFKAVDEDGNVVEPTKEYISSMVSHPKPFKCSIKPRSAEMEKLILSL